MDEAALQIDLVPAERHQFRGTQAMSVGNQDEHCVAVPVSSDPRCFRDHPFYLARGEVLAGPALLVRQTRRGNFPVLDVWPYVDRWPQRHDIPKGSSNYI